MSIKTENTETPEQITVHFKGGVCTLGCPKLEAVNIEHKTAFDKTIALIASCLVSTKKRVHKLQSYEKHTLQQKIAIVRNWTIPQMEAVIKALPSFLGEYYLKAEKQAPENGSRN
jgi:hypothetical protein